MGQSYSDFKDFLKTFLWKANDAVLIANLDNLIKMANSEIERDLDIIDRTQDFNLITNSQTVNGSSFGMSQFDNIISVTDNKETTGINTRVYSQTTESHIRELRALYPNRLFPYYAISNDINDTADEPIPQMQILFATDWSFTNNCDLTIVYQRGVPDYATANFSWVEDLYLDYYTYTCLSHCAPFLREDERIPTWQNGKVTALNSIITADKHRRALGGSPLHMKPHRPVP